MTFNMIQICDYFFKHFFNLAIVDNNVQVC